MSQSATPATLNDMTTGVETFEKERFCSFPHRHGINDPTTTPDPQTINGNPSLRIREKTMIVHLPKMERSPSARSPGDQKRRGAGPELLAGRLEGVESSRYKALFGWI